jgi:hypothetical protein
LRISILGKTLRDRDDYATSRVRRFPLNDSSRLFRQQGDESRPQASLHTFGTPHTVVLNDNSKVSQSSAQPYLDRTGAIFRKRMLQGVGR